MGKKGKTTVQIQLDRMAKAEYQRRWRAKAKKKSGVGASLTIHVNPKEIAVLDALAIGMIEMSPHEPQEDPDRQPDGVRPGRAAAVRLLIMAWSAQSPALRARIMKELVPLQRKLSRYWIDETARRQSWHENTRPQEPRLWRKQLGADLRKVVRGMGGWDEEDR